VGRRVLKAIYGQTGTWRTSDEHYLKQDIAIASQQRLLDKRMQKQLSPQDGRKAN